jgi:TPR repeat protein
MVGGAKYIKLAADQNYAEAQFAYVVCLQRARGVSIDMVGGAKYFKLAADQNCAAAQYAYGACLESGVGVSADLPTALSCPSRAARLGYSAAVVRLALAWEFGGCFAKNLSAASVSYRIADVLGNIEGGASCGVCLQYGLGVEQDVPNSINYYAACAATDAGGSRVVHYAMCLHYGTAVDVDLDEAASRYESIAIDKRSVLSDHAWRCLRGLNKARFSADHFPDFYDVRFRKVQSSTRDRPRKRPTEITDYLSEPVRCETGPIIGKGGSSTVRLVQDPATGEKRAIKIFARTFDEKPFFREIEILAQLNHPCVLRLFGWAAAEASAGPQIHTEYAENRSLHEVLGAVQSNPGSFWNPTGIGILICDIVLGMRYVHSKGILHRDLKPSNLLITAEGRALIADFGTSRFETNESTLTPDCGTISYSAPELFEEHGQCTTKVDVYAFGLILFEIFAGRPVFDPSPFPKPILQAIRKGTRPEIPSSCGEFMQGLIRRCWAMDPAVRPSFQEILTEFQGVNFKIVLGADSREIARVVSSVQVWEESGSH